MTRKFVELEPTGPSVHKVRRIFISDHPPVSANVIAAPAMKTEKEIRDSVMVNGKWMTLSAFENATVERRGPVDVSHDEVFWYGNPYNLGGYAKANREIVLRIKNSIKVKLKKHAHDAPYYIEESKSRTLDVLKSTRISDDAPFVRFLQPNIEVDEHRYRICWQMMETQRIHSEILNRLNDYYDETWIPTQWYADLYREQGVKIPIHVMPLGVNTHTFQPVPNQKMPQCAVISDTDFGTKEVPWGFVYLDIFQFTFRKGIDVLLPAFEEAFEKDKEVCLVLGTTTHLHGIDDLIKMVRRICKKSRVYLLSGDFTETDLARFYNASDAYVCTSRGEGWNLPMQEAGACGKPVIVPRNTSHIDLVTEDTGYFFDPEGMEINPAAALITGWYDQMPFSRFGRKSHEQLVDRLKHVREYYSEASQTGKRFMERIRREFTWDHAANAVLKRISEL